MRILMVHTYYREPGGEDIVYESEASLLESRGHDVFREVYSNLSIPVAPSLWGSLGLAINSAWSRSSHDRFERVILDFRPDLVHFHNTFPQVPPSVFARCRRAGVAVVQTLHNYRMLCPSATFFRDGKVCTDCLERRFAWPGILHACYRNSRRMSATIALMQAGHRLRGTWTNEVDVYIALSRHSRDLFVKGGLPQDLIMIKPNFLITDVEPGKHSGGYAIFVGRLSREKGLATLLDAWQDVDSEFRLKIVGDGPLAPMVASAAAKHPSIEWLGRRSAEEVLDLVGEASVLVFPSEWHETFGRTVAEAFARGTPVLASNLGAAQELVQPGITGLRYEAGEPSDLANKANWMRQHPDQLRAMSEGARRAYEREFTAARNYELLMEIYSKAINHCSSTRRGRA